VVEWRERRVSRVSNLDEYDARAEDIGKRVWRVDLENGRRLNRPVLKSTLKADPRFADAQILKIPRAANPFPVSDEEWDAICSRI
jgi:predicted RNA-binding protein with PUA-like domain